MDFLIRPDRSVNMFYVVGISIATHLLFLHFLPNMQSKTPPVLQKKYEKMRITIREKTTVKPIKKVQKKPVIQKSIQPINIKKQYSKISITPVAVKVAQSETLKAEKATVRRTMTPSLNRFQLKALPRNTPPSNLVKLVSSPTNRYQNSKNFGKQNRFKVSPISRSSIKNIGSMNTPNATRSVSTKVAAMVSPGLRHQIKKISTNIGRGGPIKLVGGNIARTYMDRSFALVSRPVEKHIDPELSNGNSISGEDLKKIWGEYTNSIQSNIAKAKTYPSTARDENRQGKAYVSFKLSKDGRVMNFSIENSSGHNILDQAAIQAIKDGAPYPPIPDELDKQYASLKIPISFILR